MVRSSSGAFRPIPVAVLRVRPTRSVSREGLACGSEGGARGVPIREVSPGPIGGRTLVLIVNGQRILGCHEAGGEQGRCHQASRTLFSVVRI